ncbi:AbrB/MazE/SpoVT family DNA-binding domain-containing protein [Priestia megaterium]|uniref:AbrB/MazE/SpoVT family DNA-binding domain-containing protein n=1 Tax=Priestia megaterium TaxID=1404 RepID=UPI001BE4F05E|nr:AbrB/MazE/SpoVT family DNA-binding domain-containing protein [Priestia megaterium]MBT2259275.1 AbrB/MazE/SpoVT family DNA-binding domain-containing protein [Priestia megaterium]
MKSKGRVRKVDQLGRVALPSEIRRVLNIKEKGSVKISINEDKIILKKKRHLLECMVTGEISLQNRLYSGGIVLSTRGAEILFEQFTNEKNREA